MLMWPFKKKQPISPVPAPMPAGPISCSQVDTTARFGDNIGLTAEDWIATIPLNSITRDPEQMGLPSPNASGSEVFQIASKLSLIRESIPVPGDGVYCAICHIANVDIAKLRTPCPQCGKELLKFGWD